MIWWQLWYMYTAYLEWYKTYGLYECVDARWIYKYMERLIWYANITEVTRARDYTNMSNLAWKIRSPLTLIHQWIDLICIELRNAQAIQQSSNTPSKTKDRSFGLIHKSINEAAVPKSHFPDILNMILLVGSIHLTSKLNKYDYLMVPGYHCFNTLRPRQSSLHCADILCWFIV